MIQRTIAEFRQGDIMRFTRDGSDYTVKHAQIHSFEGSLRYLQFVEIDEVTIPADAQVFATQMIRLVEVPCRAFRHGPKPVKMLHDMASGPKPFAVVCGNCDDEITVEVLAQAGAVKEWSESDVVTADTDFGEGYRACQRDVRDKFAGQQPKREYP